MKITACFIALLMTGFISQIQAQIISSLFPNKEDTSLILQEILPVPEQGFVMVKSNNLEDPIALKLEYYNLKKELVSSQRIETKREQELFAVDGLFIWDNTLIILASLYYPGPQKNHLLLYQYSLPNQKLIHSEILMETVAPPSIHLPFLHQISPDKSKLVVGGWVYKNPKEKGIIRLKVFDKKFQLLTKEYYELPYENKQIFQEDVLVDNSGNCYFIGDHYKGNPTSGYFRPKLLEKFVLAFYQDEKEFKIYELNKIKVSFVQSQFAINHQQELINLSFYKQRNKINYEGVALLKISPIHKKLNFSFCKFDKQQFKAAFQKNNPGFVVPKNGFARYNLIKILVKKNDYYLIGEKFDDRGSLDQDHSLFNHFKLEDLFVVKLDTEGTLKWMSRIPKSQKTMVELAHYFSFSIYEREKKMLFLYNDNYKNFGSLNQHKVIQADFKTANFVLTELSLEDGSFKRRKMKNFLDEKYLIRPYFSKLLGNSDGLIYGVCKTNHAAPIVLKTIKLW